VAVALVEQPQRAVQVAQVVVELVVQVQVLTQLLVPQILAAALVVFGTQQQAQMEVQESC
jgi:hypothetical protein